MNQLVQINEKFMKSVLELKRILNEVFTFLHYGITSRYPTTCFIEKCYFHQKVSNESVFNKVRTINFEMMP